MEEWLPVVGYEGLYEVSSEGRVRSLDRVSMRRHGPSGEMYPIKLRGKIMTPVIHQGRAQLYVSRPPMRAIMYRVHRIVADAFIPNPLKLPVVNHIDSNPLNNHMNNLEWCTQGYNMAHAANKGRMNRGPKNGMSRLDETRVRAIRAQHARGGYTMLEISRLFNVCRATVGMVVNRKIWKHVD